MSTNPKFSARKVVEVTGDNTSLIDRWRSRGLLEDYEFTEPGRGGERQFEFEHAIYLIIAMTLAKAGIDVPRALKIGIHFSYLGAPVAGWGENPKLNVRRHPCRPFEEGYTWLIVGKDDHDWVQDFPTDTKKRLSLNEVQARVSLEGDAFLVVDILELFNRACRVLEHDPRNEVLE